MIQTQHITTSTTKRRGSIHKNLFDPTVLDLKKTSTQQTFQTHRYQHVQRNSSSRNGLLMTSEQFQDLLSKYLSREHVRTISNTVSSVFEHTQRTIQGRKDIGIPVLCLSWYVVSSISSNLCKTILRGFPYPVALTEIQFLFTALLCTGFISLINYYERPTRNHSKASKWVKMFPEGTFPEYLNGDFQNSIRDKFLKPSILAFQMCLPLGIFQFVGHICTHKSTSMIPVSLVHSIKALSPIVTVAYYRYVEQSKHYNRNTYTSLSIIVTGVITTCFSGNSKNKGSLEQGHYYRGLLFALLSMVIFVSQNIFAKGVLTHKRKDLQHSKLQLDKITILFYCSCIGFVLTIPILLSTLIFGASAASKSPSAAAAHSSHSVLTLVFLLLLHNISHFLQAMLAFQLIGVLSPVNYSVANIIKRIVVICVALAWENKHSPLGLLGVALTMGGLYGYDRAKVQDQQQEKLTV